MPSAIAASSSRRAEARVARRPWRRLQKRENLDCREIVHAEFGNGLGFLLRPVVGIGAGVQIQWEFVKDRFAIGAQGMPFFNILKADNQFKVLTGAQGQGFLIFQFDAGPR